MRSLSSSMVRLSEIEDRASGHFLQRGRSAHRRGELTVDLRSRLRQISGGKAVQHLAKAFLGQILIGVLPDQDHRGVDAGAETLDLLPTEVAVLGQLEGIVMDPALADFNKVARPPQPAR